MRLIVAFWALPVLVPAAVFNVNSTADESDGVAGNGGGIFNGGSGYMIVRNGTVVANTIVASNIYGPGNGYGTNLDCGGGIPSAGYNLIFDTTGCVIGDDATGKPYGQDPMLGSLAANGGITMTHALPAGSVAVNVGNPGAPDGLANHCEPADRRSRLRGAGPQVGRCDIGAYERGGIPGTDKAN